MMLVEKLKSINVMNIPLMSRDRGIPLKTQASMARELCKKLGIKGVGARMAIGANCFYVIIRYPKSEQLSENQYIHTQLEEILSRAFPNHDDRSDVMTDYFNTSWIIRGE